MDVSILLLVATVVVVFRLAERDRRKAWLWAGVCLAVSLLMAVIIKAAIPSVFIGFLATLIAMVLSSSVSPDQKRI